MFLFLFFYRFLFFAASPLDGDFCTVSRHEFDDIEDSAELDKSFELPYIIKLLIFQLTKQTVRDGMKWQKMANGKKWQEINFSVPIMPKQ